MPTQSTFHRSTSDTKLAGVCGGVAERWGLDPVLVRVAFVLLALTGGVGVILYLAGWLLLPVDATGRAAVDDLLGGAGARWPRELWITLVVVACVVSFAVFGAISPFGVAPALALLAVWWFGFHRPRARRSRDARVAASGVPTDSAPTLAGPPSPQVTWAGAATPFTRAASAWQSRVQEVRSGVWSPAPTADPVPETWSPVPYVPVPSPAPPPPPFEPAPAAVQTAPPGHADPEELARATFLAEPDPLGLYTEPAPVPVVRPGSTLAARRLRLATLLALGLTWLGLGVADALRVTVGLAVYAGAGLLVVALGLVLATRWGRARGLLPAGVVLAVAAVVASGFLGPTLSAPAHEVTGMAAHPVAYTSVAAFPADGDNLDVGDLDVDLTGLTLASDAIYRATVDTGRIVVSTPPGTGVALRYSVDTGDVEAYGSHLASGSELHATRLVLPPAAGQHTLTLDLTLDTGLVEVRS
ncbi:MAG TPA: PspC domain-containing protein, partial [Friedmanniella sp.]